MERVGNLSFCAQSKLPLSTMTPPMATPWPPMNLVAECTTMSAPCSMGLKTEGGLKVLSTIRGMPCSCAILEMASRSATSELGLPRHSVYKSLVLLLMAFAKFSGSEGSTKVVSIPCSRSVLAKRLVVPPYRLVEETMWSPARAMFWMAYVIAAEPEAVARAATPPSRAAILSSKTPVVGFMSLV